MIARPRRAVRPWRAVRLWRAFRTGLAFLAFGALGLSLGLVALPWVRLRTRDRERRMLAVQWRVNRTCGVFLAILRGLGLMRFRREGVADRLGEPGTLLVANHPTLIDAVAILSCMPHGSCITKRSNTSDPTMSGVIAAAGYVPNAGGRAVVEACAASLREGRSLLLFPEGTRSPEGRLGPFHRGAAWIALETGRDLVPVFVTCDPPTLMRGQKWYDVPDRPFDLALRVGDPVRVGPYRAAVAGGESRPRVARRLTAELREVFEKGLRGVAA